MADQGSPCSVVLEGGVTSAVIYASLLAQLSRDYTFRDLGGASSGAVAAAAAAAAEFSRGHSQGGPDTAFEALGHFPAELAATDEAGRTRLLKLFQPSRKARAGFNVAMAAIDARGEPGLGGLAWRVFGALVLGFWSAALAAGLLVVGVGWVASDWLVARSGCSSSGIGMASCTVAWGLVVLPAFVAALLTLFLWAVVRTAAALRANHWGLCSGMPCEPSDQDQALTPTLHQLFQALAGPACGAAPLTFGHLWWGSSPGAGVPFPQEAERRIDLQIITTVVSLARPVRLPGRPGDDPLQSFFYDEHEWATLFPADVLLHLKAHRRSATLEHDDGRVLYALPPPHAWPVLMAVRFSLSFPVLLSAVPMYVAAPRRDVLRAGAEATRRAFEARKVYFSDGGITSNCPVHLFDAPLPRYPTFGVNLYRVAKGARPRVSRSDTHDPELEAAATPDAAHWTTPLPFLVAIVVTMFGWRDSLQRRLPGTRERMVHIGIPADAGGLNLAMPRPTILRLARLGRLAALRLRRDFSQPRRPGEATAWERHQWVRARTTVSALRAYLAVFVDRLASGVPDPLRRLRTATPLHHPFQNDVARQQALALSEGVRDLMQRVEPMAPADALNQNVPDPLPELHLTPPW